MSKKIINNHDNKKQKNNSVNAAKIDNKHSSLEAPKLIKNIKSAGKPGGVKSKGKTELSGSGSTINSLESPDLVKGMPTSKPAKLSSHSALCYYRLLYYLSSYRFQISVVHPW